MKTTTYLKTLLIGLVFAFLGCTEETIINNIVDDTDGKVNIYIEGNITNAEAQAKLTAQIGTQTENIYVQNTTQLTDITINAVGDMRDIVIKNNATLANITIDGNNSKGNLIEINSGNSMNVMLNGFIELSDLNFSANTNFNQQFVCNDLVTIQNRMQLAMNGILKFNHLKYIKDIYNSGTNPEGYGTYFLGEYEIFELPLLEEVGVIHLNLKKEIISFPNLKKIDKLNPDLYENSFFETLNLPLLNTCQVFKVYSVENKNLTLNIPVLNYCKNFHIQNSSMPSEKINTILHQFLTVLPVSGKYIGIFQSPPVQPTGQGLTDKQTLITQGNNVYTD